MSAPDLSPAEYSKVRAFRLDKPEGLNEDTRSGFVVLAGVGGFLLIAAAVVTVLVAYGVTHP